MYFVDRNKIEETLAYMEEMFTLYKGMKKPEAVIEKLAFERIATIFIEGILDVGNSMIDGFIMRDPGSYEDIIDILVDERVLSNKSSEAFKEIVRLRKDIVQQYVTCDTELCWHVIEEHYHEIKQFPTVIRMYIENELGPVSAFLPE